MAGYTAQGGSDTQWFAASAGDVWDATMDYLGNKKFRSCDVTSMRLEVNLGMSAFTGNCVASISVQPHSGGGSELRFNGRMGVFSRGQLGAQRRIEDERTKLFHAVAAILATLPTEESALVRTTDPTLSLVEQLRGLSELHASGALTDDEFQTAKSKLLS
jgi:putative oligomerization/nucleic acid binding protein